MRNCSIHIFDKHQKDIVGRLDTYADVDITIEKALSDIREPEKRKTSFTYEFTLPGNKNNKKIFQPFYENDYSVTNFDPRKKLNAQIVVNGSPIFTGYLQLVSVDDTNGLIEYNVTFYESLWNFFDDLGEFDLTDSVDLSDFDHQLTVDNIEKSWVNKIQYNSQEIQSYNGFGYVYPLEDRGKDNIDGNWSANIDYFRPAIFLKTIVDKIFNKYGWKYQSEFFESDYFKKLIIPFGGENLLRSSLNDVLNGTSSSNAGFLASHPSSALTERLSRNFGSEATQGGKFGSYLINSWTNDTVAPAKDPTDVWNGNTFTAAIGGKYKIEARQLFRVIFTQPVNDAAKFQIVTNPNGDMPYVEAWLQKTNGVVIASTGERYFTVPQNQNVFTFSYTNDQPVSFSETVDLVAGESIQFKYRCVIPPGKQFKKAGTDKWDYFAKEKKPNKNTPSSNDKTIKIYAVNTTTTVADASGNDVQIFSANIESSNAVSGDYISITSALPSMKTKDLFTSLNKLFNLYWQPADGLEKTLKIEPYDKFFSINDSLTPFADWTHKVHNKELINIQPLYELTSKEYLFRYNSDTDWANADYESSENANYGQRLIDTNYGLYTDFITDKTEIKPLFSSTPLVTIESGSGNPLYIPSYTKKDSAGNKTEMNPKPRLLFWNGLRTNVDWNIRKVENVDEDGKVKYSINEAYTSYPFAAHVDDAEKPTEDLNFGICEKYYWDSWAWVTNNNLFNKYWRNWVNSVIDKDGHLLTAQFKLDPVDIANLNLKNFYQFNGVFYRINKLKYSVSQGIADVELIKVLAYPLFKPSVGYFNTTGGSPFEPGIGPNTGTGGWTSRPEGFPRPWRGPSEPYLGDGGFYPTPTEIGTQRPFSPSLPFTPPGGLEPYPITQAPTTQFTEIGNRTYIGYWATGWETALPEIGVKPWVDTTALYPALTPRSQEKIPVYKSQLSVVSGNEIVPNELISVLGVNNKVSKRISGPITINGNNNQVDAGTSSVAIFGNGNKIRGGVKNTTVLGSNQIVTVSDVVYINGTMFTKDGQMVSAVDLVRGGIDEIQNRFSTSYPIYVNGGKDAVKNWNSNSGVEAIIGNLNGNEFNSI